MRKLILVRHAPSKIDPSLPPYMWGLTQAGRDLCSQLAEYLALHEPEVIITSEEPKAIQTGELVARELGIVCLQAQGLHEHRRQKDSLLDLKEFQAKIKALFAQPDQLVFGLETANEALARFTSALETLMSNRSERVVAVVSHGTVMSLYYGAFSGQDPWAFWQSLGMPGFYTVSWPDLVVSSEVLETATLNPHQRRES
jgi:broad specificity phosphatase PhoE